MPGVPVSTVRGGVAHGMTVITKSGAFGDTDTLLECIEYLQGASAMRAESSCRQ
jgi:uncharacterized protein YgbK (DUF1537 family)